MQRIPTPEARTKACSQHNFLKTNMLCKINTDVKFSDSLREIVRKTSRNILKDKAFLSSRLSVKFLDSCLGYPTVCWGQARRALPGPLVVSTWKDTRVYRGCRSCVPGLLASSCTPQMPCISVPVIIPTGKPPPVAVRLAKVFQSC